MAGIISNPNGSTTFLFICQSCGEITMNPEINGMAFCDDCIEEFKITGGI